MGDAYWRSWLGQYFKSNDQLSGDRKPVDAMRGAGDDESAGLYLVTTYEAIKISSGSSFVYETKSQLILSGSWDVNFTMDLVLKDIGLF